MDATEAEELARQHLAELGDVVVKRRVARIVGKPTTERAIDLGAGHPLAPDTLELGAAAFKRYVDTMRRRAATDPETARLLLDVAEAPQLVCGCSLGSRCHARVLAYLARDLKTLDVLVDGMGLRELCWWHAGRQDLELVAPPDREPPAVVQRDDPSVDNPP